MRIIQWFRNDLRLLDNTALAAAAARADELLPVFIIDPGLGKRLDSPGRRTFLRRSVDALAHDLKIDGCPLLVVHGDPPTVLAKLAVETRADVVTHNRDYSPFAMRRDRAVASAVAKVGARVESFKDRVIFESHEVVTQNGGPFRVFTPYRNAWLARWNSSPANPSGIPRLPKRLATSQPEVSTTALTAGPVDLPDFAASESEALARLDRFLDGPLADYVEHRDLPAIDGTSRLSPALRFGVISIRTCVAQVLRRKRFNPSAAAGSVKWLDELIWREFYQALLAEHPRVLTGPFQPQYRNIEWNNSPEEFEAWCEGRTGYPVVDAAMRQLVRTGWMHNRARMIVASFLVKDLLVDWRKGERVFLHHLLDGDPAANNGGWQWAASTGTDAQPYFRIFNPVAQGKRYDPDGEFVRRFVPELADVPRRFIHSPWESPSPPVGYPAPIVDHAERRVAAITRFAAARDRK